MALECAKISSLGQTTQNTVQNFKFLRFWRGKLHLDRWNMQTSQSFFNSLLATNITISTVDITAVVPLKDGTYVDTQFQYNQVSADFGVSNIIGTVLDRHGFTGILLSAEVGKRYAINEEYTLLYSGQLIWGNFDRGNATTTRGQSVDFGGDSNLTLRGGARIEYKSNSNQFHRLANLYFNTLDSWDITFENETFSDSKGTVLAEIGFGGEVELSPTSAWFGQAAFKTSLKDGVDKRDSV